MKTPPTIDPAANTYENLVNLMSVHAEASASMAEMEADLQREWLELVDTRRKDYAKLQEAIATSAEGIELLATLNPQWFEKAKTLKTPYGSVAFRSVTKLEIKNEEVTILLIEQQYEEGNPYLITRKELSIEALEQLSDDDLKALRIRRVTTESCTVKAGKIDLGKAVKKSPDEPAKVA